MPLDTESFFPGYQPDLVYKLAFHSEIAYEVDLYNINKYVA